MSNEDKAFAAFVGTLALVAVLAAIGMTITHCWYYSCELEEARAATAAGLVQGSLPGHSGVYWVKPEPKSE